jgi:SPP1 family predicted phage head-tail adaptor
MTTSSFGAGSFSAGLPGPRVPIGARRTRLLLEAPVEVPDEAGGNTRGFTTLDTLWGTVVPAGGEERLTGESLGQVLRHRVALRFRAGITAGQRLRWGERLLAITAVADPDGRHRQLICLCEEIRP